jgi:Ca2+-transporting ATPase
LPAKRVNRAIAKECHILQHGGDCLEGSKFRAMSNEEKRKAVPNLKVLARSFPQDKADLVDILQRDLHEIVGVTGDGVNDATALRHADVGFSMGLSGSEVAKEASDIVLTDDNVSVRADEEA